MNAPLRVPTNTRTLLMLRSPVCEFLTLKVNFGIPSYLCPLRPRKLDALPFGRWMKAIGSEHHPRLHQLFIELAHFVEHFLARHDCAFAFFSGLDQHNHSHGRLPGLGLRAALLSALM